MNSNFAPGQYATLGIERPEKRSERPYSIVSSPYEDEIEFFFELVPQGELTPHIYKLQIGDEMLMRKVPKGRFTLDTKGGRTNHLLVSTVTGVAPFVSYIRSLHKTGRKVSLPANTNYFCLTAPAALGIRVSRRITSVRRRSALAHLRAHGEPPLG